LNKIKTSIIPISPNLVNKKGDIKLNKEAICIYVATGFFLDTDTFYKNKQTLPIASDNAIDENGFLKKSSPYFKWHYTPRNISFEEALEEFTSLFETIIEEQVGNQKVILPLSGGLDSRSQAVALHKLGKAVHSYSYQFKGGYPETKIAKQIAKDCNFNFKEYQITNGYLWHSIARLVKINQCYSEFTHPRQMAVIDEFDRMGEVFSLGHWGDVLFDRGAPDYLEKRDVLEFILKKIVKKGGMELAISLWKNWQLEGDFQDYLRNRIQQLLDAISIENVSAKIRAFKSMYWAPRWTSTNLSIFSEKHPITLPYYDNRMCQFICTVPEEYLADRKLQIAYIKKRNPLVAKITWQDQKPFHLYNYHKNKSPYSLPYRIGNKIKRELKNRFGKPYIQRNWELQFLGKENDKHLQDRIFDTSFLKWMPKKVVQEVYENFKEKDQVYYSHPLSMLLTLSLWHKNRVN